MERLFMKENTVELIKAWIKKADRDLQTVKNEFNSEEPVFESICFHSQQAAEKYLKAYLIYLEIPFKKTHEIGELITLCEVKDKEILNLKEESDALTDYAVEIRYPDDFYEPSIEESEEASRLSIKIRDYIRNKITNILDQSLIFNP